MSVEALYSRRIGVQPRSWRAGIVPRVTPPGRHVDDAGPRAGRTLRRSRAPEELEPRPSALPRGSSWCASDGELLQRIAQAEFWRSYVSAAPRSTLTEVEGELAAKLTLQKGAASGWDVFPDGLGLGGGAPLNEAMEILGKYIRETFPHLTAVWTAVPRGTNSGCPTYSTSDLDKLFHALLGRQLTDWESALTVYRQYAGQFEAISEPHAIMFSRSGPVSKPVAIFDWVGDVFTEVAQGTSVVPRRRAVFGVPAFINHALLGHANAIKYAVMRLPWTAHPNELAVLGDIEHIVEHIGADATVISDDISGFDLSVRRSHQEALARHIYARYWPAETVDLWLGAQGMGVLGGPLKAGKRGFLYSRGAHKGVTTSGIITTSLDGTLINLARVITAMAYARRESVADAFDALVNRKWSVRVWGDDTVIIADGRLDVQRYEEGSAAIGYTSKIVQGATFLMKHYDLHARAVYPLMTRVMQQTFWNERGGRTEEIELLGLYARTTGAQANPLWPQLWPLVCAHAPPLARYGVTDRLSLRRVIADPGYQLKLRRGILANASAMAEHVARAERGHSEDQGLIDWVEAILGTGALTDAKLDLTAANALSIGEAARRAAQLSTYLAAPIDSRSEPPSWATELLKRRDLEEGGEGELPEAAGGPNLKTD